MGADEAGQADCEVNSALRKSRIIACMLRHISVALFLICAPFAIAQTDSNSVTVTASRTIPLQADQAIFSVSVNAGSNSTLDDVLAAVQPAGITIANFSSVFTVNATPIQPLLQWTFTLVGPLTNTKATVATLTNLLSTVAKANAGLAVSFSLQGTQVSPQAAQSQPCAFPDLLSDAQAKAQALASSASRFVSGILALATSISNQTGATSQTCTATVKFSLVGF
jgi:hypothetical protein